MSLNFIPSVRCIQRNSYYHELFLQGVPHLCKKMKRPGVNKKFSVDAEHEPEFYTISEMHPLPGGSSEDSNLLLPSSLMGKNNWDQSRIPVSLGDVYAHNNAASVNAGQIAQGQGYNRDT